MRRSNLKCYTGSKMSSAHKINTIQVLSYAQAFSSKIQHVDKESLIYSWQKHVNICACHVHSATSVTWMGSLSYHGHWFCLCLDWYASGDPILLFLLLFYYYYYYCYCFCCWNNQLVSHILFSHSYWKIWFSFHLLELSTFHANTFIFTKRLTVSQ